MADFAEEGAGKAGGFLKKKAGPLEYWQWGASALGLLLAYLAYRNYSANSAGGAASAPATNTSLPGTGSSPTDIGTTISGQLTDLTGQVGALQQSVAGLTGTVGSTPIAPSASSGNIVTDLQNTFAPGSSADTAGTAYWNNYLSNNSVGQTAAAFESAAGANQLNAGQFNAAGFVQNQYVTELGRSADPAGLANWEGQLTQGGGVTAQNISAESSAFNAAAAKENPVLNTKG